MNIILFLIGLVVGSLTAFFIARMSSKGKNVPRREYEALAREVHEAQIHKKVAEERVLAQQQECSRLYATLESKARELTGLQSQLSALDTVVQHQEAKAAEMNTSLLKQKEVIASSQIENLELRQELAELRVTKSAMLNTLQAQQTLSIKQEEEIDRLKEKMMQIVADNSALVANKAALQDKLLTQKEEIMELQKTAHLQFERIANQLFEEKSEKFAELNKVNMETILKPLGENMIQFKQQVAETYDKESKQRFSLEAKVKELVEQTNKVSSEANNLASALKGQAKKQGNWGEMILESILQSSGLVKGREYFLQQTIKDEEGRSLRPDVLVTLPDNRTIIIDSKVSLVAYDRFSSADTPEEQALHLANHVKSIYHHIDDLQGKNYDNLEAALDFTMMFVPIEPAYLVAIQAEPDLWAYAYARRILLISPTNLIACLKLMADLWKRELQSKNAMEIVRRGELLYEKFVSFASTLEDVGKHIHKTQQSYTMAIGQLTSGSGHLVGQALKLKNLGLKSSKEIPAALLPIDQETSDVAALE